MRLFLLLVALVSLLGCASGSGLRPDPQRSAALADVRAKLSLGVCDMALANQIQGLGDPALAQEAGYQCLQQGQLPVVERLLGDYTTRYVDPPNADYSAYLLALAEFVRFEMAIGDDAERLQLGRQAHRQLVGFVRLYPDSAYRPEVAPRLEQILEGMARADYTLAQLAIETGNTKEGAERLRYVVSQYPRTTAAKDAARWLEFNRAP